MSIDLNYLCLSSTRHQQIPSVAHHDSMLLITLSYFGLFLFPGFAFALILGIQQQRFLLSYSLSISVFTTACLVTETLPSLTDQLLNAYVLTLCIALLVATLGRHLHERKYQRDDDNLAPSLSVTKQTLAHQIGYPALLIGLFLGYIFSVSPYTELPSDVWQHLFHIKTELLGLKNNSSGFRPELLSGSYAHRVHAFMALLFGVDHMAIVLPGTIFTSIILILSFYFFFCWILRVSLGDSQNTCALAFGSTVLSFLSFGVDQFSYFRYYALAPTIIAYPLFLTATLFLLKGTINRGNRSLSIATALVFGVFAGLIHTQELMFLLIVAAVYIPWTIFNQRIRLSFKPFRNVLARIGALIIASYFFTAVVHFFFDLPTPETLDARFIKLSFLPTAYGHLYVLNPIGQFFGVLSLVGLVAYTGFALRYAEFRDNSYFLVVLSIPFVTIFNPFFLSIFFQYTTPYHAWRILYLIPFPLVATTVTWLFLSSYKTRFGQRRMVAVICAVIIAALIIDTTALPKSPLLLRYLTLKPTGQSGMNIMAWPELKGFLDSLPEPINIVTDPVTGYFIRGATKHHSDGFKFHNSFDSVALTKVFIGGKPKHLMHPELDNRVFVYNRLDGPTSSLGKVSGHWPDDILRISRLYPDATVATISENPDRFLSILSVEELDIFILNGYDLHETLGNSFK